MIVEISRHVQGNAHGNAHDRPQRGRFHPFAKPSANDRYLRTTAIDHRPTMAAFLVADEQSREPTARFRANWWTASSCRRASVSRSASRYSTAVMVSRASRARAATFLFRASISAANSPCFRALLSPSGAPPRAPCVRQYGPRTVGAWHRSPLGGSRRRSPTTNPTSVRHASFVHGFCLLSGFVHQHLIAVRPVLLSAGDDPICDAEIAWIAARTCQR